MEAELRELLEKQAIADHAARVLIDGWRSDQPPPFLMTHHLYGNIVVRLHAADRARSPTITAGSWTR
jgi:hypothetical protein